MNHASILVLSLVLLPMVGRTEDLWISNHTDFPGRKVLMDLIGRTNFTYDAKGPALTVAAVRRISDDMVEQPRARQRGPAVLEPSEV